MGSTVLAILDASDLHKKLPGTGIASHFSLSWDTGSLGRAVFSKHESLVAICVQFVSAETGSLEARCLGTPSVGARHDGAHQAEIVLDALSRHPCELQLEELRCRLAAVGGDGAITKGGPRAKHSSTQSAEILWHRVKGKQTPIAVWGLFHRSDRAQAVAAEKIPMIQELLDVANECNRLFGVNSGKVLLRSVAGELGERALAVDTLSGTRKLLASELAVFL